jgi:hypothetical protein
MRAMKNLMKKLTAKTNRTKKVALACDSLEGRNLLSTGFGPMGGIGHHGARVAHFSGLTGGHGHRGHGHMMTPQNVNVQATAGVSASSPTATTSATSADPAN